MISASGSSANSTQRIRSRRRNCRTLSVAAVFCLGRLSAGATGVIGGRGVSGASSRGTGLRRGSAIAALSCCMIGGTLLNQPAQVFFDHPKLGNHLLNGLAFNAGKNARHRFLAQDAQPLEQWPGSRGEEQPLGAPIRRVRSTLDQPAVAELVQQTRECNGLQIQNLGQLRLVEAL